ncbi:MAG: O-antigen ligase family protein [Patescibacteria group bacterium]
MRTFVSRHWPVIASVIIFGSLITGEALQFRPVTGSQLAVTPIDLALVLVLAGFAIRLVALKQLRAFGAFVWRHPAWKWSALFLGWATLVLLVNAAAHETRELLIAAGYLARLAAAFFLAWGFGFEARRFRVPVHEWFTAAAVALIGFGFLILLRYPHFGFMRSEGWDPHIGRLLSTFYDPNLFGMFAILAMGFVLAKYCFKPDRSRARLYLVLFAAGWLALYLTYSRSAWVAGLIAIPAIAWKRSRLAAFLIAAVFVAALFVPTRLSDRFETVPSLADTSRYSDEGFECDERRDRECDPTGSTRISSVQEGFELALQNPVIGVGYNAYGFAPVEEQDEQGRTIVRRNSSHGSDISLLNIWATTGLVGLGLMLAFLVQVLRGLFGVAGGRGEDAWIATALLWFTLAFIAASFFNNVLLYTLLLVPWLLLVAVTLPAGRSRR